MTSRQHSQWDCFWPCIVLLLNVAFRCSGWQIDILGVWCIFTNMAAILHLPGMLLNVTFHCFNQHINASGTWCIFANMSVITYLPKMFLSWDFLLEYWIACVAIKAPLYEIYIPYYIVCRCISSFVSGCSCVVIICSAGIILWRHPANETLCNVIPHWLGAYTKWYLGPLLLTWFNFNPSIDK